MESRQIKKIKTVTAEAAEYDHSDNIQLALSNTVVLQTIFKFLPACDLKRCSLVSKLWKFESYSHRRYKRKWMARIPIESPCASLRDFNELIGSTTVVPYNGLSLHIDQRSNFPCQCNSPEVLFTNVMDKLTFKHVDIFIFLKDTLETLKPVPCAAVTFGVTLLEQKIVEVESLEFSPKNNLQCHFDSNWPPALLPKLKAFCFPKHFRGICGLQPFPVSFLKRLTNAATNLNEIQGPMDFIMLRLIPEEKWRCVKDFEYLNSFDSGNRFKVVSQFVSKRPSLRKITLQFPQGGLPTAEHPIINALIELSQMTLEVFEIRSCTNREEGLKMPQLPKLRILRLCMTSSFGQAIEKAESLLNQNDGKGFPQLEEFHLSMDRTLHRFGGSLPRPEVRDESDSDEIGRLRLPNRGFPSVLKLRLELDPASSSFVQIKSLFPAVTDMRITCEYKGNLTAPRLPYKQIFRLWQNLETISIKNKDFHSSYNLDSAFCGLDQKEVELLEQEDDNFLMAVELVPIAPCVLTMRNLVSFNIEYPQRSVSVSQQLTYMTRVGQILAPRYLPRAVVKVPLRPSK